MIFVFPIFAEPFSISIESERDYEVLEKFFKITFYEGDYGYVLTGVKPVSVLGFGSLNQGPFFKDLNLSKHEFAKSILMREAISVWDRICPSYDQFVLNAVPQQAFDSVAPSYEVRFVNLPKLKEVIQENIRLFQYVLDPVASVDQLVDKIAFSKEPLSNVLKDDLVLIGIVLGFEAQNSLVYGRIDSILWSSISADLPPFSSKSALIKNHKSSDSIFSFLHPACYGGYFFEYAGGKTSEFIRSSIAFSPLQPSQKFSDLEEEILSLESNSESLPKSLEEHPRFIFGAYTGETSNQKLFQSLQNAQSQIQQLLKKSSFLETVLKTIGGKNPVVTCQKFKGSSELLETLKSDTEDWVGIVKAARDRTQSACEQAAFVKAFCHPTDEDRKFPEVMGATKANLKGLKKALANLENSDAFFKKVAENQSLKAIVPEKLYYSMVAPGSGKEVKEIDLVRVGYTFEDLEGNLLYANHDTWLSLSQTFPGFAHGIQGMRCGEKRMILIHPAFAYGALTTLPPCITLRIQVHLLEVGEKNGFKPASLKPHDFSWLVDPEYSRSIEKSLDQLPRTRGAFYRDFLEKIKGMDIHEIIQALKKSSNKRHSQTP